MAEEQDDSESPSIEKLAAPTAIPKYSYKPTSKGENAEPAPHVTTIFGKVSDKMKNKEGKPALEQFSEKFSALFGGKSKSWRDHLHPDTKAEVNELVKTTHKHKNAYKKTLKVRDAQLWVALAELNQRLKTIEEKLDKSKY